jgi:hypothetical protein
MSLEWRPKHAKDEHHSQDKRKRKKKKQSFLASITYDHVVRILSFFFFSSEIKYFPN